MYRKKLNNFGKPEKGARIVQRRCLGNGSSITTNTILVDQDQLTMLAKLTLSAAAISVIGPEARLTASDEKN